MIEEPRTIQRDVEATIVPYGDKIIIPEGTEVFITHKLGGNFTVRWTSGMAQIMGKDADALGEEVVVPTATTEASDNHEGPPDKDAIWAALKKVYDPEIPVNIVDLGLVYTMEVEPPDDEGNYHVRVDMTLTAPGCGMGPTIAQDAKYKVEQVPGVHNAEVNIVWDPVWHQDMITEEGKMELGLI
ncbi:MAG: putative Fe-S cluster assembly protein SufT [Verrucomicrobia bacterium]|nr:putative Fe-S cluster assembly protein SufT [Verrucomicrobiota bacterium]